MVIGVDLDGVVADYTGGLLKFAEKTLGLCRHTLPPPRDWGFSNVQFTNVSGETFHFYDMHNSFVGFPNHGLLKLKVLPYAIQSLRSLRDRGHTIRIVTQRGAHHADEACTSHMLHTLHWLQKKLIPFHEIVFTNDKTSIRCDVMLEDAPHHIQAFSDAKIPYLIFDQPYNQKQPGIRVNGWPEAMRILEEDYLV